MRFARILCAFCLLGISPAAMAQSDAELIANQGLTGSLLAPSPATPAKGVVAIEPYFLDRRAAGSFDGGGLLHSTPAGTDRLIEYNSIQYGLTDNLAIQLIPGFDAAPDGSADFSDLPVRLKYRWFGRGETGFWNPSLTTGLGVTVPLGPYQRLKGAADGFGAGAWMGNAVAQMQNFFVTGGHVNRGRIWASLSTPLAGVAVHDISSYGTAAGFAGTALPGATAEIGIADEFAIDRHWVLALDVAQDFARANHVQGGGMVLNGKPGSDLILAPAIEYNFAIWIGLIAGVEITPRGHNASNNVTPQVAVNMFF